MVVESGTVKDLRFKITDYHRFLTVAARGKHMNAVPSLLCTVPRGGGTKRSISDGEIRDTLLGTRPCPL